MASTMVPMIKPNMRIDRGSSAAVHFSSASLAALSKLVAALCSRGSSAPVASPTQWDATVNRLVNRMNNALKAERLLRLCQVRQCF